MEGGVEENTYEAYEVELTYNYFFQHLRHLKLSLFHFRFPKIWELIRF
jgi:hypothetical protein